MIEHALKVKTLISKSLSLHEDWRLMVCVACFATACCVVITSNVIIVDVYVAFAAGLVCAGLAFAYKKRLFTIAMCVSALYFGAALAQNQENALPKDRLDREAFVSVKGSVSNLEVRPGKATRLTVTVHTTSALKWLVDKQARISVRTNMPEGLKVGESIAFDAVFEPMGGRLVPNGFDFAQYNRIRGIATQGFAVTPIKRINEPSRLNPLMSWVENQRTTIANRILEQVEQPASGITVALTTGYRQYMDPRVADDLRDSGLAHLLAISGLHMGLITGAAFFFFEFLLAAFPAIALKFPIRKVAASIAWLIGLGYLALSGAGTSTVRAFVMVTVALLAVMTDRRVISLRSVSIAALLVLMLSPSAILSISFQMSFAATIGIVVAYELYNNRENTRRLESKSVRKARFSFNRLATYVVAVASTSLIAQLSVAPIALYHFQSISLIGILVNLTAIPLMAFIIMPAAVIALLAMPLGLDGLPLTIMAYGIDSIVWVANTASDMSMSVYRAGPFNSILLVITGIGLFFIMVFKSARIAGLAITVVFLAMPILSLDKATVLISNGGRVVARETGEGQMAISGGRRGSFRDEIWQRYWNIRVGDYTKPLNRQCDTRACQVNLLAANSDTGETADMKIVVSQSLETTRYACSAGNIVIANYFHRRHCRGAALFLSSEDIDEYGPAAIWFPENPNDRGALRMEYVNDRPERQSRN